MPKILVIEDDSQVAEMISKILIRHGNKVHVACDGVEAVSKYMVADMDLIILDLMMPFFSGYWYCDVFKRNPLTKKIPVVILSVLSKDSDVEKGFELGADAYLTKPFTEENLAQTVQSLLARKGRPRRKARK